MAHGLAISIPKAPVYILASVQQVGIYVIQISLHVPTVWSDTRYVYPNETIPM